jgi:outer membrane lipoprotein-sorting protein
MQSGSWLALVVALLLSTYPPAAVAAPVTGAVRGDPQVLAEWQAAMQKFDSARSWRSKRTFSASGQSFTQTSEYMAPDRMRMVFATDAQGRVVSGMVRIGSEYWVFGTGGCSKSPTRPPQVQRDDREAMQAPEGYTAEITKGVAETIDGVTTQTYTMTFSGSGLQGTMRLYVQNDTGYPKRTVTTTGQGTFTIDYSDYNTAITITAPC